MSLDAGAARGTPSIRSDAGLLFEGSDWTFDLVRRCHDAMSEIAERELALNLYRTRVEVITAEQMLDAYSSTGMPVMYRHWSFGKRFAAHETSYRKGMGGLALEIVINSDPSVCYLMEENSMTMQATVLAHAAFGHNHFFKNNHVFRQWTDAGSILEYLSFARRFVALCEERHGSQAVERVLDAAHALVEQGVDRYGRRERPSIKQESARTQRRIEEERIAFNDLWRTLPVEPKAESRDEKQADGMPGLPEENILYFLEKHAPRLEEWERELLRVVRNVATYFEPQRQTKVMNEGCACWVHYYIMNRLNEQGRLTEGQMLEFMRLHSSVVYQPGFDDPRYGGLNPYTLGFFMMRDIERICTEPTAEDRDWFPQIAGNGRPIDTLRHTWANFRDESFVLQYLSPRLMREMHLFKVVDDSTAPDIRVDAIHDERGYRRIRQTLAAAYDPALTQPHIEVVDANMRDDRALVLHHTARDNHRLDALEARRVLRHLAALWKYRVTLREVDAATGSILAEHEQHP
jgi:stage V sporulation protein R